jgi:PhnB protein
MTTTVAPRITPYLYYRELERAIGWLIQTFGWWEKSRVNGPDGRPFHAELGVGTDGVLMMGYPGPEYRNPKDVGHATQGLYVRVDDVDALFARATKAGAKVIEAPKDQEYGDRRCGIEDFEGHQWFFAQPVDHDKKN